MNLYWINVVIFTLTSFILCDTKRYLQANICSIGEPIYVLYAIDAKVHSGLANCKFTLELSTGTCNLVLNDINTDASGYVCFSKGYAACSSIKANSITGNVTAICNGIRNSQKIPEITSYKLNEEIKLEHSIFKLNLAVGYGCAEDRYVWKPRLCSDVDYDPVVFPDPVPPKNNNTDVQPPNTKEEPKDKEEKKKDDKGEPSKNDTETPIVPPEVIVEPPKEDVEQDKKNDTKTDEELKPEDKEVEPPKDNIKSIPEDIPITPNDDKKEEPPEDDKKDKDTPIPPIPDESTKPEDQEIEPPKDNTNSDDNKDNKDNEENNDNKESEDDTKEVEDDNKKVEDNKEYITEEDKEDSKEDNKNDNEEGDKEKPNINEEPIIEPQKEVDPDKEDKQELHISDDKESEPTKDNEAPKPIEVESLENDIPKPEDKEVEPHKDEEPRTEDEEVEPPKDNDKKSLENEETNESVINNTEQSINNENKDKEVEPTSNEEINEPIFENKEQEKDEDRDEVKDNELIYKESKEEPLNNEIEITPVNNTSKPELRDDIKEVNNSTDEQHNIAETSADDPKETNKKQTENAQQNKDSNDCNKKHFSTGCSYSFGLKTGVMTVLVILISCI